jgi:hypothetical protein
MHFERPDRHRWTVALSLTLGTLLGHGQAHASDPVTPLCEYRTLDIDERTGAIRLLAPQKTGPEDCNDIGAAIGGFPQRWRDQLPKEVKWQYRADAARMCESAPPGPDRRSWLMELETCVVLQPGQSCTLFSARAVSHAQLAHALRECRP